MYQTSFINKTPSAEILIRVKATVMESRGLLKYENKKEIGKLCESCPTYNRKWACPPCSPAFSHYNLDEYPYAWMVLFTCDMGQFSYINAEYMKIKAAGTILKSRMDRLMRSLEKETDGIMISNGSCRLCNPCSKKEGQECRKPEKMRFSMEALGLNVGRITADIFAHELLWYKDKTVPGYLSAAACLLMKKPMDESTLGEALINIFTPY